MLFKCRCASSFGCRITHMQFMQGTWKSHHSMKQLILPAGLHRVYYQLKDNDPDNICADDGWIEIKYRNSNRIPRFNGKDLYYV